MDSSLDDIKLTVLENSGYDEIPEDVYEVMIEDIKKEMRPNPFKDYKEEISLNFTFNITEGEHSGRKLFRRVSPKISIQKPSNLYKIVQAIEADSPSGDYFEDFKLSSLLGRFLRVTVKNITKGDNTYSNIENFMVSKLDSKTPKKNKEKNEKGSEEVTDEDLEDLAKGVK